MIQVNTHSYAHYDPRTKTYQDNLGRTVGYGHGIGGAVAGGAFMQESCLWIFCF